MKKAIILMLAVLFIYACGGGGGGSNSENPIEPISISDNTIMRYVGNEILTYNFSYDGQYSDGSGAVILNGIETAYFYDFGSESCADCIMRVTELEANDISTSTNDVYFYNDSGLVHYLTSNNNYYTNQDDHAAGSLVLPQTLNPGQTWTNTNLFMIYDSVNYYGNRTFTIINKETIDVPFGAVEAYKINYSGSFEEYEYTGTPIIVGNSLSINGTLWVHPEIGIIKIVENATRTPITYYYSYSSELVSLNWDIH